MVLSLSSAVTIAFAFIVVKLFVFHVKLIRSNQTTIEFYENAASRRLNPSFTPPFSKSPSENFREVFPHPILLFVPFVRLRSRIPFNSFYHYDPLNGKDYLIQKRNDVLDLR